MISNDIHSPEGLTSKQAYREKVWNYLEKNDLADIPRPVFHRIPNFKGAGEAAQKLKDFEVFSTSRVVKVNPDKPQEIARLLTLEAGKTMLVPIPSLRKGLFQLLQLPNGATNKECRLGATRRGFDMYGKPVGLDSKIKVDLVIIGSVAVSKEGHRIGKGKGYADLEYAMMTVMGAVDDNTVIITTVHDCQVFDSIPHELFESYDVPVDIIITPTQVINVSPKLPRPPGIIWSLLSERRLKSIPILKTLRAQQMAEGKDCTLKETDSSDELQPQRDPPARPNRNRERRIRNRQRNHKDSESHTLSDTNGPHTGENNATDVGTVKNDAADNVKTEQQSHNFRRRKRRSWRRDSVSAATGPSPEPGATYNSVATEQGTKDKTENRDARKERSRRRRVRRPPGDSQEKQHAENFDGREQQESEKSRGREEQESEKSRGREEQESEKSKGREEQESEKSREQYRIRRNQRRNAFNFSLRVDNIATDVRVRELKAALAERGVRPNEITWKGSRGFAMLHFRNPEEYQTIIASLQDIKLREEGETLMVQLAQPTRVEVTDITSL